MAKASYGPNSETVNRLIDVICALTPQATATLIEAHELDHPPGVSKECVALLFMHRDVRNPEGEEEALRSTWMKLFAANRFDDYHAAFRDVWDCIPRDLAPRLALQHERRDPAWVWRSLDDLVERVLISVVAADLIGATDAWIRVHPGGEEGAPSYGFLTRAWRWSKLWGELPPEACP